MKNDQSQAINGWHLTPILSTTGLKSSNCSGSFSPTYTLYHI